MGAMATTRKPVSELAHAQRFWITSKDRTWVRVRESDLALACGIAAEVSRTTPDAQHYYGHWIGRIHVVRGEMPVVPL